MQFSGFLEGERYNSLKVQHIRQQNEAQGDKKKFVSRKKRRQRQADNEIKEIKDIPRPDDRVFFKRS